MLINRFLSILLLLLYSSSLFAQDEIIPVFKNSKWAVIDTSLKTLAPYQFDEIVVVNKSYFIAKQLGFYGLFDKNARQILPLYYQEIITNASKYLVIKDKNLYGLCDYNGNKILSCEYDSIQMPDSTTAILRKNNMFQYYNTNFPHHPAIFEQIKHLGNQIYLLTNQEQKYLYHSPTNSISRAFAKIDKKQKTLFFCTDENNKKFIVFHQGAFQLFETDSFYCRNLNPYIFVFFKYDKMCVVSEFSNKYVDIDADDISPPFKFQNNGMAGFVSSEYINYSKKGKKGLLSDELKVLFNAEYDDIKVSNQNVVVLKNGKKGLYTIDGKMIVEPKYDDFFKLGDYWTVKDKSRWGMIDTNNRELIFPQYDDVVLAQSDRFVVELKGKKGLIDSKNKIYLPIEYQSIECNTNALILRMNNKYGIASLLGNIILSPKYAQITKINNQYFIFSEQGKLGIISANGTIIAKAQFSDIKATGNENIFFVSTAELQPSTYKQLKNRYRLDINIPSEDNDSRWFQTGIINSFGEIMLDPKYYSIQISADYEANMFYLKEDSSIVIISFENNGKLIEKTKYNNYIEVKNPDNQIDGNFWKQGGKDLYYGLYAPNGILLIDHIYRWIKQNYFKNQDLVLTTSPSGNKIGIVNERSGKIMLPAVFKEIHQFDFKYSNLARCIKSSGATVLIDTMGNTIQTGIGYMEGFKNQFIRVNKGGKHIISTKKAYILPKVGLDSLQKLTFDHSRTKFDICEGGKWGVLDNNGNWLIKPKYQFLQNYFRGVFIAQMQNKWGVINPTDQQLIEFKYDEIRYFADTLNKNWLDIPYYQVRVANKWGVIDSTGNLIIKIEFDGFEPLYYSNKLHFKSILDNKKILYGLINKEAKEVLDAKYLFIGQFHEGFARISTAKRCWQFIDLQLQTLRTDCFIENHDFNEGIAGVKTRKGWGFVDSSGKLVIADQYLDVGNFDKGYALAKIRKPPKLMGLIKSKQIYIIINKKGETVCNTKSRVCSEISNQQVVLKKGKKFQIVDVNGKNVLPGKYSQVIENAENGLFIVQNSKHQFALYNNKGVLLIPFCVYKTYTRFSEGLCSVEGERKGFIDTWGNFKFSVECYKVGDFNNGLARVNINNKWGYIDKMGKIVIPAIYTQAGDFKFGIAEVRDEHYNLIYIDENGKLKDPVYLADNDGLRIINRGQYKGIADKTGRIIVNPVADAISLFAENYAPFGVQKRFGLFDEHGNMIADTKYMLVNQVESGLIKLENLEEIRFVK